MKRLLIICSISLFCLTNCEFQKEVTSIPDGTYTGTFQRNPEQNGPISNVSITFSSGTWTGVSDSAKYPALCHGNYRIVNDKLVFTCDCAWTADFDWSLILSGSYEFNLYGEQLFFLKNYDDSGDELFTDLYKLKINEE
jgi:hypothetical protein